MSLRRQLELSPLVDPSGAYGMDPPVRREEQRRGLHVLFEVLLMTGLISLLLALVAGQLGSRHLDIEAWRKLAGTEPAPSLTMGALTAFSHDPVADEVNASDPVQNPRHGPSGTSDYRVDMAGTPPSSGFLEFQGALLDRGTSRAVTRCVTWRGRS